MKGRDAQVSRKENMKIFSKLMNCIATVVTILVIAAAGVLFVPRIFGYTPYIVLSGSMEPVIETGSVVFINTEDTDVAPDDIIAFKEENGAMVTHRVVSYDAATGAYTTKGDANDIVDANTVTQEQIVGTYEKHIPKLGYALATFQNRKMKLGGREVTAGPLLIIMTLVVVNGLAMFISTMAEDDDEEDDYEYEDSDSDDEEYEDDEDDVLEDEYDEEDDEEYDYD